MMPAWIRLLVPLLAVACAVRPTPVPARSPSAADPGFRRVPLGLCEDYPEETRSFEEVQRDAALLRRTGAQVLRVSMGWDELEPRDDAFDFSFWDRFVEIMVVENRIRLVPYVAYTPAWLVPGAPEDFWRQPPHDPREFGELMEQLARRYRGRIHSWELWNEPDNADYWRGTVAQYAALVREGAAGVERGDPTATVVLGGLAGTVSFLRELLALPGVAPAVDVVNVHAYFETWNGQPLETLRPHLEEVAALVGGRPLWLAEVGYSNHRRGDEVSPFYRARFAYEHTLAFQAVALFRTATLALASPHVGLLAWYELKDPAPAAPVIGDVNNRHLGVAFNDHREKPALAALTFLIRLFGKGHRPLRLPGFARQPPDVPVELHGFALPDGSAALVAWIPTNAAGAPAGTDTRQARLTLDLRCPGPGRELRLHDEAGRLRATQRLARSGSNVALGPFEVPTAGVTVATLPGCF